MEPQKKLLMIVNPRAGRSKPRGPLYDAAAALCDAGYLLRIRRTTAAGDAATLPPKRAEIMTLWWPWAATAPSTRSSPASKR
ncbi:MAG: hypothetical protein ACLSHO_07120 [Dysosmobacter sp.]